MEPAQPEDPAAAAAAATVVVVVEQRNLHDEDITHTHIHAY